MDAGFQRFCAALGKRVRKLRLRSGLTQEDMQDYGFVVRHYQRIEAGRSITLATIWRLARAFGVPPRSMLPAGVVDGGSRAAKRVKQGGVRGRLRRR